jgi:putative ABC transport system permease protein
MPDQRAVPLREAMWGDVRSPMRLVMAAAAFVLLIACANLANLLLARSASRGGEISLRTALGAGRLRTAQQLIVEHGVLALLGGVAGSAVVVATLAVARRVAAGRLPAVMEAPVDLRVVAFLVMLSTVAGILFGAAPVLRLRRSASTMVREGRGMTGGRAARIVRGSLVGAQVALCFVLLAGTALLLRGFRDALAIDPGFDTENVLAWEVSLPASRYGDARTVVAYKDAVLASLAALPGVEAAGVVDRLPLGSRWGCAELAVDGAAVPA